MKYRVVLSLRAIKELEKMDKYTKRILYEWIYKNLKDSDDPRFLGKPLSADRKGQWRYRVGDYRILAEIKDDLLIILVVAVGHRREVYKL